MENIRRYEDDSHIYITNLDTGYSFTANKVKTYLGGYVWDVTIGNLKTNEITHQSTVFNMAEVMGLISVEGGYKRE